MDEIEALSNDELLAQVNAHDPYDAEFVRRFRALEARIAKADALLQEVRNFNAGKSLTIKQVLEAADDYERTTQ
jgi:hypothetical protein